jgi:hypothetical protein
MAMLAEVAKDKAKGSDGTLPQMDGTFTLHTDGAILANNTDEGAKPDRPGKGWTGRSMSGRPRCQRH